MNAGSVARKRPVVDGNGFVRHLPLVRQVVRRVCNRYRVSAADQADFEAAVFLKLIEDDYAVFRRFEGRSGLQTFLSSVVHRFLLDRRNSEWGKWRPSSQARRLGDAAVQLERLTVRDGVPSCEAVATLAHHPGVNMSSTELHALEAQLPPRVPRRRPVEIPETLAAHAQERSDRALEQRDAARQASRVRSALVVALASLHRDDRRLLRKRFHEGHSLAAIARATGADQKALYRRFERILGQIRGQLESMALTGATVVPLLGHEAVHLGALLERSNPDRPS
jgi:RNA polymerase sigma factor (sigma-70 family)